MNPVDQEFLHNPSAGVEGDCFRAVIASLLELPISDVPHFAQLSKGVTDFWELAYDFLDSKGYEYVPSKLPPAGALEFHAMSGPSPRGNGSHHGVVGRNGEVAHDPHPSRAGLAGRPGDWRMGYLVPKEAAT